MPRHLPLPQHFCLEQCCRTCGIVSRIDHQSSCLRSFRVQVILDDIAVGYFATTIQVVMRRFVYDYLLLMGCRFTSNSLSNLLTFSTRNMLYVSIIIRSHLETLDAISLRFSNTILLCLKTHV